MLYVGVIVPHKPDATRPGFLILLLHAHLPFVRHPEHERFLEESWLYEAITECYLPLLLVLEGWERDGLSARLTWTLSPTLCAMLLDPLLCGRYRKRLEGLILLAEKEVIRNHWNAPERAVAQMYLDRFQGLLKTWDSHGGNLVKAFRRLQDAGVIEIITCAATHAVLPLLATHSSAIRAQVRVACDHYAHCFGCAPRGIWLPECAYVPEVEPALREAGLRWFVLESHGVLHANPRPVHGLFAPIWTPSGQAVFGRDIDSAQQVWSRHGGYPGDYRYRDFYRDIGYDLDFDYVQPWLPSPEHRGFTGIKYHAITGPGPEKTIYDRAAALAVVHEHAAHFLGARAAHMRQLAPLMKRAPVMTAPYDAELFGHWWFEGPEFIDQLGRQASQRTEAPAMMTPSQYLADHATHQTARPEASSWGEEGYWRVWLNAENAWIYPRLLKAQESMIGLARHGARLEKNEASGKRLASSVGKNGIQEALRLAANELLLAQASDWPFQIRAGASAGYARQRLLTHLGRFDAIEAQIRAGRIDSAQLATWSSEDAVFPDVDWRYWI
jgi:1,4-alpha-glucan branching enzyme